jgi:alanyl-tRNA synthetase
LEISSLLCTPQNNITEAVKKQLENADALKYQIGGLKRRIIADLSDNFNTDKYFTLLFQDGFDIKELQLLCDALHKKLGGIRAVFSGNDATFLFAMVGDEAELFEFFKEFKNRFNVKGGGRGSIMQGTVFASKNEILDYIK